MDWILPTQILLLEKISNHNPEKGKSWVLSNAVILRVWTKGGLWQSESIKVPQEFRIETKVQRVRAL